MEHTRKSRNSHTLKGSIEFPWISKQFNGEGEIFSRNDAKNGYPYGGKKWTLTPTSHYTKKVIWNRPQTSTVKATSTKFLEKNIGQYLCAFGVGKDFLEYRKD